MKETFIHIGLHKTATTFFQNKVFPLYENLYFLSRPYTQLNHSFNKLQYADDSRYKEEEFLSEIDRFSDRKVLISDEMLSGQPFYNYINRTVIANRLKRVFPNAVIIIFLRGQKDMLFSLYSSWVKGLEGTQRFEDFLWIPPTHNYSYEKYYNENLVMRNLTFMSALPSHYYYYWQDSFSLHLDNFLYYELVSFYKALFQNVHVFLYEDFLSDPQKVILELERIIGEKLVNLESLDLNTRVNKRLDHNEIKEFRLNNVLKKLTNKPIMLKLLRFLFRNGQKLYPKLLLDSFEREQEEQWKILDEFYKANNKKLIDSYPEIALEKYSEFYET